MPEQHLQQCLQEHFGFSSFRSGQKEVISLILKECSAAAIFPTGSGKSLCYQLPALLLPHLTLVVSPLLALMKDQIDFLKSNNIAAASIDSTQSREEASEVMQGIRNGQIKILMIAVERLKNERFRELLKTIPISLLVVDEAHCISEWGHNFRPDYIKLPDYQKQFKIPQVLLLTATATPPVIEDMSRQFAINKGHVVMTGFYRPNLNILVQPCRELEKQTRLIEYLQSHREQASIVYVTLQNTAEKVAQVLNQSGIKAMAYHAGLGNEIRENIQEQFMQAQDLTIVATIAFGMGIDKRDIRHVIHYDLPKSIENYAQEIGRAGRDGQSSNCVLLANQHGLSVLENFVYGDTPELSGINTVLHEIASAPDGKWEVLLNPLTMQSNIRQLPLKTLLVYLELKGLIQAQYSYFANYRYKLCIAEQDLLVHFQGERQQFVQAILTYSQKAKIWFTLDMDQLVQNYSCERQRVIIALEYFQEKGWIELESKQMTEVYQALDKPVDRQADQQQLAQELYQQFKQKELAQIHKLEEMLNFFQSERCLSQQLAQYFGETQVPEACGHCSVCLGQYQPWLASEQNSDIPENELRQAIQKLTDAIQIQFSQSPSIELMCRYFLGISTPWLTKIKAKQLGYFARYEHYPYQKMRDILRNTL